MTTDGTWWSTARATCIRCTSAPCGTPAAADYGWGVGFATGIFFGFAISGGWHSPCCYGGGGGVYINHRNTNININNSYNRWGGKTSNVSGPGGRDVTRTQVGNTTLAKGSGSNNVYAGRDGQVYRRDEGGGVGRSTRAAPGRARAAAPGPTSAATGRTPATGRRNSPPAAIGRRSNPPQAAGPPGRVDQFARPAGAGTAGRRAARSGGPSAERGLPGRRGFSGGGGARAGGGGRGGGGRR